MDQMREEAATCLLIGASMDLIDQESTRFCLAQKIVKMLDCKPLATNLARAYVNNTGTSFQHYLNMLKTKCDILFRYGDEDSSAEYNHTVFTLWQLSLERVLTQNQGGLVTQVLVRTDHLHRPQQLFSI